MRSTPLSLALLALALPARAELPMPTFPECGEPDRPDLCPDDLGESWDTVSYVRDEWVGNVDPAELDMGTGLWADRAWRVQTGRTDVVIAVLDSGVLWDEADILNKHWLNTAELPLPQDADGVDYESYDANADGVVNIQDYADDPRVDWSLGLDDNMDDVLDPSDLIWTFSDGIDDDDNGYTDDVAGWDFLWNDNDPYDDTRFDHGAFEARLSMAEGNDGQGWIGICPNCMVLNLRVGDSFVADGDNFASAATYAVDRGALVIQEALGALNNGQYSRDAIEYAWDSGVLVVGSAADEDSYHPNAPGVNPHTLYVHAIVPNDDDRDEATSFLAYSNCTNHGARLDLSVPSTRCSSGATGMTAGVAGLVYSQALDEGLTLTAGEVYQLLVASADDIALQPDDDQAAAERRYPSKEGWDRYFGYGRLNAETAVLAVRDGAIPPEADLSWPGWFEPVDPVKDPVIDVEGMVRADRSSVSEWVLQWGLGDEPGDDEWTEIGSGSSEKDGVLASFDLSAVPLDPSQPIATYELGMDQVDRETMVNRYTVTLRLVVTDSDGNVGKARRSFYLLHDPDLMAGFPMDLGASLESSPNLVDLDGDGALEIVLGDANGTVHALRPQGTELSGWPVQVELLEEHDSGAAANHLAAPAAGVIDPVHASVVGSVAAGDLDGDGTIEVVAGSLRGSLFAWHADGSLVDGFPVSQEPVDDRATDPAHLFDEGFFSSPALGDLDGDGDLEIVVGGMDQLVYAWHHDGSAVSGWPVAPSWGAYDYGSRIVSSPAVGDLDGDGKDDIVIGTNETLNGTYGPVYAISGEGNDDPAGPILPGWPVALFGAYTQALPYVGEGVPSSPALADVDGDGHLEVAAHTIAGNVVIYNHDGSELYETIPTADAFGPDSNANDASAFPFINSSAFGDLNADGTPDVVTGALGSGFAEAQLFDGRRAPLDYLVNAWDGKTGVFLPAWPRVIEDLQFFVNPAIADLDGDKKPEAISGSGGFVLHAWDVDGEEPEGWPKFTGQWILASAAVGDIDGDDLLEVVVGTRGGLLFAWDTPSPAGATVSWQSFGHDPANTANHEAPLPGYNSGYGDELADEDDRGCCKRRASESSLLLVLPLLGFGAVRRRR